MAASVLIVDDDRPLQIALSEYLSKSGYEVRSAYCGDEALEHVAKDAPDLIVLDYMMPGMNGFEVLRRLKSNPTTEPIPVVFLTGVATGDADVSAGWEAGVHAYLEKPFEPAILEQFIRRIIEGERENRTA